MQEIFSYCLITIFFCSFHFCLIFCKGPKLVISHFIEIFATCSESFSWSESPTSSFSLGIEVWFWLGSLSSSFFFIFYLFFFIFCRFFLLSIFFYAQVLFLFVFYFLIHSSQGRIHFFLNQSKAGELFISVWTREAWAVFNQILISF